MLDIDRIRKDFPILGRQVNGHPLTYLDSAATSQKPRAVLEAVSRYYEESNANAHRGVYSLAREATDLFESARARVARFLGAPDARELVFVRNATEAINLVAHAWGDANLAEGDVVLVTAMEHHSNLVPWHLLAERKGVEVRGVPVTDEGLLDEEAFHRMLTPEVKLLAVVHASNVLGTVNPVKVLCRAAHAVGVRVLVDGAQSAPHLPVDLADLDCDFFAFSGHKMLGPMGVGGLWIRSDRLEEMTPFLGGGEMIREVGLTSSTYADPPWRFEAGTPDVASVVGLRAAVDYLDGLGMDAVAAHDRELGAYARETLGRIPGIHLLGPDPGPFATGNVATFTLDGVHPHDIAQAMDERGIAIRAGHHCAQPLMDRFDLMATARASFYLYNQREEVDRLAEALDGIKGDFAPRKQAKAPVDREPDDELFREVVLDHYLEPEGTEPLEDAQVELHGKNPLCGDEVTLRLKLEEDRIQGLQVLGEGCSISVASGSIMVSLLKGRTLEEAQGLFGALKSMLRGEPVPPDLDLGDLQALEGLKDLPVRVKCALLAWTTLEEAVDQALETPRGRQDIAGEHHHA